MEMQCNHQTHVDKVCSFVYCVWLKPSIAEEQFSVSHTFFTIRIYSSQSYDMTVDIEYRNIGPA
jgi:hypothetical protein